MYFVDFEMHEHLIIENDNTIKYPKNIDFFDRDIPSYDLSILLLRSLLHGNTLPGVTESLTQCSFTFELTR